jgi:hypothetical protein
MLLFGHASLVAGWRRKKSGHGVQVAILSSYLVLGPVWIEVGVDILG